MLWSIDSRQNSVSAYQCINLSADKLLLFKWSQAQVHFLKCIWNKSCSWASLWKFWFQTNLGRENSTGFYMFLTFPTIVTRWSHSTSNFYALNGQKLTGEFMRKNYAASGNLFTDNWSWQSFVSSCDDFYCLFQLDVQNEIQSLSRFFCNSWLVCLLRFWLRNAPLKSLESDFGWHRFQKWAYSLALVRGVRGLKSLKRFWPHLMAFRSSISTVNPEQLLSLRLVYARDNYLTYNSIKFKKPLDIFGPQIQRKSSKEYLVMISAVKESPEQFSCLEFILKNRKHREADLKHK